MAINKYPCIPLWLMWTNENNIALDKIGNLLSIRILKIGEI